MVVADPTAELLGLVTGLGDPAPLAAPPAAQRVATLLRRRFGLALPPPFVSPTDGHEPVRPADPVDAAAIAAVKWRTFGTSYRGGVLPDEFLDVRTVVPPATYWAGRASPRPGRRHHLLVWGRPGAVFGYADCGPAGVGEPHGAPSEAGEVYELYVDPAAQRRGGGARLLAAAQDWLLGAGYHRLELSTLATNPAAQAFYERHGWSATGTVTHVDTGIVAFDEVRYARHVGLPGS